MNRDEELVGAWLESQGHAVKSLTNGADPPDIVVDGKIAVEVTTIASYAVLSLGDFIERVCKSLGGAEHGRGYWILVEADDEGMLQDRSRPKKIKKELERSVKAALRRHYANPEKKGRIQLPHGVEMKIMSKIKPNRDDVRYKVAIGGAAEGVLPEEHLVDAIQSAIDKKTSNRMIQERTGDYSEWWLAITDPHYMGILNGEEIDAVANDIDYHAPWSRILLMSTTGDGINAVHCCARGRQ